jgi:hypothetical protein
MVIAMGRTLIATTTIVFLVVTESKTVMKPGLIAGARNALRARDRYVRAKLIAWWARVSMGIVATRLATNRARLAI